MQCYNCEIVTNTPIAHKGNYLCENCYRLANLPTYILTKLWHSEIFYDADHRGFPRAVTVLPMCGFKLFKKRKFLNRAISPKYKEAWMFRYFGYVSCRLLEQDSRIYKIECCSTACGR
jgi:hypothetical protein